MYVCVWSTQREMECVYVCRLMGLPAWACACRVQQGSSRLCNSLICGSFRGRLHPLPPQSFSILPFFVYLPELFPVFFFFLKYKIQQSSLQRDQSMIHQIFKTLTLGLCCFLLTALKKSNPNMTTPKIFPLTVCCTVGHKLLPVHVSRCDMGTKLKSIFVNFVVSVSQLVHICVYTVTGLVHAVGLVNLPG